MLASPRQHDPDEQYSGFQSPNEKDPELIKWQLSGSDIVEELKHIIRGEEFDIQTDKWKKLSDPLINEEGIKSIISIVSRYINKNTILSTLDETFILMIMRNINLDMNEMIIPNHKFFGIKKAENIAGIINSNCDSIYFALMRANKGGEKTFLTSTEQRSYAYSQPLPESQKQGGGIFGFFRGKH